MNLDKVFECIFFHIATDYNLDYKKLKEFYLEVPPVPLTKGKTERPKKVSKKNKIPPVHNHPPQKTKCATCELCRTHGNVLDPAFE